MRSDGILHLSAADVRAALPMSEAIEAMRDAFTQLAQGQVVLPPRQSLLAEGCRGVDLVMPCHSLTAKLFSLKTVTVFEDNPSQGLPMIQGLVILTDARTGRHLAMLDGTSLTALRTGAASGLATDLLARKDARVAGIFGAGVQARHQLEAVHCVHPLERALVFDPDNERARGFSEAMSERLGVPVSVAASAADCAGKADILCTATPSAEPVFPDDALQLGCHLNAIGAFRPETAEIPAETVCRARVVVDHIASAREEAGDLLQPLQAGLIRREHFQTELGGLLLGRAEGRTSPDQITLFKSVGVAIQDLCAAARAVNNARHLGKGSVLVIDN